MTCTTTAAQATRRRTNDEHTGEEDGDCEEDDGPQAEAAAKACSRCKRVLPFDAFQKNATHKDGHQSACRECMAKKK